MKIQKVDKEAEINPADQKLKQLPKDQRMIYLSPPRAPKINFYQQYINKKKFIPGVGTYEGVYKARDYQGPYAPEYSR